MLLNLLGVLKEDVCGPFSVSIDNAELFPRRNSRDRSEGLIWWTLRHRKCPVGIGIVSERVKNLNMKERLESSLLV